MGDEARRERLAAALRANLRRRKDGASDDAAGAAAGVDETAASLPAPDCPR